MQGLLAVAERSTFPAEAQTALLKAQALMARHNLRAADLPGRGEPAPEFLDVEAARRRARWRYALAVVVADNFRCMVLSSRRPDGVVWMQFAGLPADTRMAVAVYRTAALVAERQAREHVAQRRQQRQLSAAVSRRIRQAFLDGFVAGLQEGFARQVEAHDWALVVAPPESVREAVEQATGGRTHKWRSDAGPGDWEALRAGARAGRAFAGRPREQEAVHTLPVPPGASR